MDGSIFHKTCAKCEDCKCQITLSNFTKTGNTLLCKTHYFKKFSEQGTYLGGEKFAQKSRAGAYSPPPPPTTVTSVATPKPVEHIPIASASASSGVGQTDPPVSSGSVKDRMKMFGSSTGNQTKCAGCSRIVYANDPQIVLDGITYHKECAKCSDCRCQITIQNFTKSGTTLYCKTHYFKKFNEEGTYLGGEKYNQKSSQGAFGTKKMNIVSGMPDAIAASGEVMSMPVPLLTRQQTSPMDSVDNDEVVMAMGNGECDELVPVEACAVESGVSINVCSAALDAVTPDETDSSTTPLDPVETGDDVTADMSEIQLSGKDNALCGTGQAEVNVQEIDGV